MNKPLIALFSAALLLGVSAAHAQDSMGKDMSKDKMQMEPVQDKGAMKDSGMQKEPMKKDGMDKEMPGAAAMPKEDMKDMKKDMKKDGM